MCARERSAGEIEGIRRRDLLKLAAVAGAVVSGPGSSTAPAFQQAATTRKSRAIVIGINKYAQVDVDDLELPVRDACRFTRWLIDKAQVDPLDITLLTSPAPTAEEAGELAQNTAIKRGTADFASVTKTIREHHSKPGAAGERLYFYYSGHGLMYQQSPEDFGLGVPEGDGIVPSDFGEHQPISTRGLLSFFDNCDFVEQFYFFDACRNVQNVPLAFPLPKPLRTPPPPKRWQYILFAAAPGQLTKDVTGCFTDRLLAVLNEGEGKFVDYDKARDKFLVRFNRLWENVQGWFGANCQEIGQQAGEPVCQRTEMRVLPGIFLSEFPCLVELPQPEVKQRKLTLGIEPPSARDGAKVAIRRSLDGKLVLENAAVPADAPFTTTMFPTHHSLIVTTPLGMQEIGVEPQDADYNGDIRIDMQFDSAASSAPAESSTVASFDANSGGSGTIAMFSPNPLSDVELFDIDGNAVPNATFARSSAIGSLEVTGLNPGIYRAQTTLDGELIERYVPLGNHTRKQVEFVAGGQGVSFPLVFDPATEVAVKSIAEEGDAFQAVMVGKGLALQSFPQGIRVVLGVDLDLEIRGQEGLNQLEVSLGTLDSNELEKLRPEPCIVEGVATFTKEMEEPGPYRVRIRRKRNDGLDVLDLATVVIDKHLSQLNIEQSSSGRFRISQFAPPGGDTAKPSAEAVFKLHQVQSDIHDGGSRRVPLLLRELMSEVRPDPISFVLAAYVAGMQIPAHAGEESSVSLGQSLGLPADVDIAGQMLTLFPEVPDGHVVIAQAHERAGETEQAKSAYHAALSRGFPILNPFLKALADAVRRYAIAHPRAELLMQAAESQLPGLIWTAWRL